MKPSPAFDCKTQGEGGLIGAQALGSPSRRDSQGRHIPIGAGELGRGAATLESHPREGEEGSTIPSPVLPSNASWKASDPRV